MNASERRATYLDDLGRLLQPLSAVDRIDVVDTVRTRIDRAATRLGHEPSGEEMGGILAGIGAVEDVAEEALAARSNADTEPAAAASAPGLSETTVSAATQAGAPSSTSASTADAPVRPRYDLSDIPAMEWPEEQAPRPGMTKRWVVLAVVALILLGAFFVMFLLPALLLLVGVLFLWASPLWSRSEKAIGTVVPALGLGAFLPLLALGLGSDGSPALAVLALMCFAAGVAALVWLARRGLASSRQIDAEHPAPPTKKR